MMMLLRRANNDDCSVIPDWNTPTIRALASEIPVTERRLRRIIAHLCRHGWLEYEPGMPGRQPRGSTGKGKGRFRPLPRAPEPCLPPCEGIHQSRKRGLHDPHSDEKRGSQDPREKGVPVQEFPQVSAGISPRDSAARGEREGEMFGERLTVTIAGAKFPALRCKGCGDLVAEVVSFDGCHATCEAPKQERMGA